MAGPVLAFGAALALAEAPAPLPSPLTLEAALALADEPHPDLALARSEVARARARVLDAEARTGVQSFADLTPEWANPTTQSSGINDSRARLVLAKPLYDFGRTRAFEQSASAAFDAAEQLYLDARARRRLDIMARFFEVLLADMRYAALNEGMAQGYVAFDRLRERHALGQVSDVDLLESENRYREALDLRTEAQKRQAATRLALAIALGRPDALPGELAPPPSPDEREAPDYRELLEQARETNPAVAARRAQLEAARAALEAERARRRPMLTGELEAAAWERELASRNDARATLNLRIPLYQGAELDAAVTRATADLAAEEARLAAAEQALAQAALDLVQAVEALKVRRDTARQRLAFRDLYLDRSRALYEMEVRTDLGDALTRLTEAQWLAAAVDFELALTWAKIDALTGRLVPGAQEVSR